MPTVADSGSWKQKVTTPKTTLAMASAFSIIGKEGNQTTGNWGGNAVIAITKLHS